MTASLSPEIESLIARQEAGYTLEQPFYTSPEIYKLDIDRVVSRQWQYVDHVSRLPNPGDYLVYEIDEESIVIVRGADGKLRAHFNVCRHRGSRICLEPSGNVKRLVCPYHAWAYDLEGRLTAARQMPADFDPGQFSLHPCRLAVLEGLMFINLQEENAADCDRIAENVMPFLKPHGLARTKVVHREVYPTHANWRLAVENFRECYHCAPSHPEYAQVNEYVWASERELGSYGSTVEAWKEEAQKKGRLSGHHRFPYPPQPHHVWRIPIRDGFLTLTKDGTPAGPLMGDFDEYDGAETGAFLGALSYLYVANDHATTFRFTPISPVFTEVVLTWLVHEDAVEGEDYDVEHLKWMWDVTTIQDTRIINDNQKGVNSTRYGPGRYSLRESGSAFFSAWYLSRLNGSEMPDPATLNPGFW